MKLALLLLGFIAVCAAVKWHQLDGYTFEQYVTEFKRSYSASEREFRRQIVENKLKNIREHNSNPSFTWKRGVNQFTDRTDEEFQSLLGVTKGLVHARRAKTSKHYSAHVDPSAFAGVNIDWRQAGIVTAVKDQGQCGSCWTFATAETVETYWAKATGQLADLSEQQILDCTPNPDDCGGSGGCGGGTVELALDAIIKAGGLSSEWTYPYYSYFGKNQSCMGVTPFAKITKYVDIKTNDYASVLSAITTVGPLAISVDASTWSEYESGVFDGCSKDAPDIDHAVQLVGVGTDDKLGDYWLVRNSWSPAWGEHGYIRLARQTTPTCGVDKTPSDGDGCNNGPSEVTVCGTCGILYDTLYAVVQA